MNYDSAYFQNRGIEPKHYQMANVWIDYFKPEKVLDYGCGRGPFVSALTYFGVNCVGFDSSQIAVDSPVFGAEGLLRSTLPDECSFDLVTCIDVMEHVPIELMVATLTEILSKSNKFALFSICMLDDPNFEKDETHVTKRSKEWWIHLISGFGWDWIPTPSYFPFAGQHLIFMRQEK
jgi:cyclopropane fatty-acyl-phospholipid synthase-like methyltransferase